MLRKHIHIYTHVHIYLFTRISSLALLTRAQSWLRKLFCLIRCLLAFLMFFLLFKRASPSESSVACSTACSLSNTLHNQFGYSLSSRATASLPLFHMFKFSDVPAGHDDTTDLTVGLLYMTRLVDINL